MSPVHWLDRPLSADWTPSDPARYSMFRSTWQCVVFFLLVPILATVVCLGALKGMAWLMVETWK